MEYSHNSMRIYTWEEYEAIYEKVFKFLISINISQILYLPPEKFLRFIGVFLETKFRWNKFAVFCEIWKKKFPEKNPTSQVKSGVFLRKNEIPIGRRPFFERTSEAKCSEKQLANLEKPLANLEKPLVNECGRRVHLTTTPLSCQQASEASGNELPPSLPTSLPPDKVSLIFMKISRNEV